MTVKLFKRAASRRPNNFSHSLMMICFIGLVLAATGGCATLTYEGASDYRFSETAIFDAKFQNINSMGAEFKQHDPISIYLKNAYFAWCPTHFMETASAQLAQRKPKCRVAMLVNVGSRLEQVADRGSTDNPGRLVFFSRDIQKQQFINQSYGSVYSNANWDGNDLTLDVTVLQMAEEDNARTEALLKTLASIGTSSLVSLGGQQVIDVLNKLGTAFVQASSKDSVIGAYRLTLVGKNAASSAYIPLLREGDLILVRAHDEQRETIDWSAYVYDPTVGKLYERLKKGDTLCDPRALTQFDSARIAQLDFQNAKAANGNSEDGLKEKFCYIEDHHRNYAVFSFVKSSAPVDWVPSTTLSALQTAIASSSSPTSMRQAVNGVVNVMTQRGNFALGRSALDKLKTSDNDAVKSYQAQKIAGLLQCSYLNSLPDLPSAPDYAKNHCVGAENWRAQSLLPSEYEYFAQRLVGCGVSASTFSASGMVGTSSDGTQAESALSTLTTALAQCK